ncbi:MULTISPECIES: DUF4129 domain-containing protein [Streptomyces]|uniref:DUF4129 domain-containing protein n=1 Tax=Streptomyces yangpuensis TaxID=1648182 RepID=A0ABY5PVM8_9ACTN|nr:MULTISPECIES: DUF4129 domain-containing protein [Streptomyces]MBZ9596157.1 DUF4129 domain-containing protein [Streptomyces erythrochromogenes]UUY48106.1 DUF4129 domain-containing protein [Streptomyces yangpuensis]
MMSTGGLITRTAETPPVTTPRTPAQEAAERELSKPMYHENDPNLLDRALRAFLDWLDDLFGAASGATPGGAVGLVAVLLLVVLAIAALWWRLGSPRRTATSAGTLFDDGVRSAADHRTAAEAHATAGRWTEAVQERMRAVVRSLEERTLLDPRPGRTADEAAAEAAVSLPDHAAALRAAARTFDDVTYGGRTADADTYARLRTLDLTLARTKPLLTGPTA